MLVKSVTYQGLESSFLSYSGHVIFIITVNFLLHQANSLNLCQTKPSIATSSKAAWTRNGDSEVPMFPSRVRTSFARFAWYEAEESPETSEYCLTIRRINTEMYKILTAVLLRFKPSRLALFDPQDQGTTILRNLRSYLTINKAQHPRKLESLATPLSERQMSRTDLRIQPSAQHC